MTGILLGLFSALCWGCADYLVNRATARVAVLPAVLVVQVVGLVALLPALALARPPLPDAATAWQLVGLGAVGAAGYLLLFRAFASGALTIVSPVASAYGAYTVALAVLFLHERPSPPQLAGIGLVLVGVVLAAVHLDAPEDAGPGVARPRVGLAAGLPVALAASVMLGVVFFWLGLLVPRTGALTPTIAMRLVGSALLGLALGARGGWRVWRIPANAWPLLLPIGALDAAGFLAYSQGITGAYVSIVAPLGACFSVVTVALAALLLGERPAGVQRVGIALVIVGVAALALR